MGVPAFFRWLTVRYPKVVIDALSEDDLEELEEEYKAEHKKQEATDPNEIDLDGDDNLLTMASAMNKRAKGKSEIDRKIKENNPTVDNLYLDMNGIIHPCAHPQAGPQPQSEGEIFENIYEYMDKIMRIVRP
jgi:5'-3' exoribonuclease 2